MDMRIDHKGILMADRKTICLNMIVKSEMANLARCLGAVAPWISAWVIGDTGSTDGTQDFIRSFFAERGIPGELHSFPFENFAQARNEALAHAYATPIEYDYLLLNDADMELVVDDPDFQQKLQAPCYDLLQHAGISYWNARLVRRNAGALYHGVTHEYLAVDGDHQRLDGVWFKDHASGANRVDKFERDIRLLTEALADDPENARYVFYLAQSYRDAGRLTEAVEAYAKRATMGGGDEEAWYARLQEARCLLRLGDDGGFVRQSLAAFSQRPHRAEPLYDLARYHRERSRNEAAALFAEQGIALGYPDGDTLFIEDYIFDWGLREELSIAANYSPDPARKARGAAACNWLAQSADVPEHVRSLAQYNLQFYPKAADEVTADGSQRAATIGDGNKIDIHRDVGRSRLLPADLADAVRQFHPVTSAADSKKSTWVPETPMAGTELMVGGLKQRMAQELDRINLQINHPGSEKDSRPRVVWIHHDVNQEWVQWCSDKATVDLVDCFVFVSHWQREQYLKTFGLPPERCVVLRNATDVNASPRRWEAAPVWRCAYASTPFRGLSVLLDAWEHINPVNAELHVWSSMKLYLGDDGPYSHLYERAQALSGVFYHGIVPNAELRMALRDMHFLTYPSTFAETSCLAVIEAMAAGCRVICPSLGALPETTSGFAHVYPWTVDANAHAATFAAKLREEFDNPWNGQPERSLAQQAHFAEEYDWSRRVCEWRQLIEKLCN